MLEAAVAAARPAIEERGHALSLEISPGDFRLSADETRLEQVVANLLSNASRYTPDGGRITVRLTHTVENQRSVAIISVKDTGRGIPPAMLDRVFELFVQVEQALDRSMGGLGLGLTLVKRLVELHDGTVTAHSAGEGKGTEFVVRLPLSGQLLRTTEAESRAAAAAARRKVVLVEDQLDLRQTMRELLEDMGHSVVEARDGMEGLKKVLEDPPDVALIDIGLPRLDGYELAQKLRADPRAANVYLIAVTGYGGATAAQKARDSGFDHHVTKPVNLDELPELVARKRTG